MKYGTLTCADGFIRLDIHSKDVMLAVCFAIFILQGNNKLKPSILFYFQHWVAPSWHWLTATEIIKVKTIEENRMSWKHVSI